MVLMDCAGWHTTAKRAILAYNRTALETDTAPVIEKDWLESNCVSVSNSVGILVLGDEANPIHGAKVINNSFPGTSPDDLIQLDMADTRASMVGIWMAMVSAMASCGRSEYQLASSVRLLILPV